MCLRVSYKKFGHFFASLKLPKKVRKELDPDLEPDVDRDPLARGTDPGIQIRIRTKMSRIPIKTAKNRPGRSTQLRFIN
jgi:hypothetical protein